jgi:uncharacterized membrane protein
VNEGERRPFIPPELAHVSKERMLALTDGVMSIAMTLLVLDLDLPEGLSGAQLRRALDQVWSQAAAFLLSALVITLFWRAHHAALRNAGTIDSYLFWLNVMFLVLVSLMPFPTQVLRSYGDRFLGPGLYGTVIGTAALMLYLIELRAARMAGASWRTVPLPAQATVFLLSVAIARLSPTAAIYSWLAAVPLSELATRRAARGR